MLGMTKDEGLLQTVNFELNPDLYGLAQVLWKHLGPMFLFGRVGDYDTWPGDWEKCQDITNVISDSFIISLEATMIDNSFSITSDPGGTLTRSTSRT